MSNLSKTPQTIEKEMEMETNHSFAKSSKLSRSPPAQQPVITATRACSTKPPEMQVALRFSILDARSQHPSTDARLYREHQNAI
ncbi:hypothetical protein ACLKA6_001107 [Drosophila palustris]